MRPRIVLADDHPMVLACIQKLLESEFDIVATVEDGRALIEVAQERQPDVIVLDWSMPSLNGLQAAQQLKKLLPHCKLVFLTMHADANYAYLAFDSGASGFVLKRSAASELSHAIHTVLDGRTYLTPLVSHQAFHDLRTYSTGQTTKGGHLSARQQEVLQLIAEGQSTKEIATLLGISTKTVEFHKSKIMGQLRLHTTAELAKYALTHGLLENHPPATPKD